jgi:hypothetical protein
MVPLIKSISPFEMVNPDQRYFLMCLSSVFLKKLSPKSLSIPLPVSEM